MSIGPIGPSSLDRFDDDPPAGGDAPSSAAPALSRAASGGPSHQDVLARLQASQGSGPSWLGFADRARNVEKLAAQLGRDGRISSSEIEALVVAAKDFGRITDAERGTLLAVLDGEHGELDDVGRTALAAFLGVDDPGTASEGADDPMPPALAPYAAFRQVAAGQRTLGVGDRGDSIRALQRVLTEVGFPIGADGHFGPRTAEAVRGFQRAQGLRATGSLDRATLGALGRVTAPRPGRLPGSMDQVLRYRAAILDASRRHGVPPEMIAAIIDNESDGNPNARSFDGGHGKGLMQIDDRHHRFARTAAVFDPAANIDYGTRILADNLRAFGGNRRAAIAAYNAGIGGVQRVMARGQDPSRATYDRSYVSNAERLMAAYRPHL